jgi:hypothetical protein
VATGLRLLLSAVEQPSGTATSTSTTTTVTKTVTASGKPPSLSSVSQSATSWRTFGHAARHRPPVGTTFSFKLSEAATVTISFYATGRQPVGKGHLTIKGNPGTNKVIFRASGPRLRNGTYVAVFTATDSAHRTSSPAALTFSVVR